MMQSVMPMRKGLNLLSVMVWLLCSPQGVQAMLYQPTRVPGMGDQWLYYHDGVHYLYHLYEQPPARHTGSTWPPPKMGSISRRLARSSKSKRTPFGWAPVPFGAPVANIS